MHFPDKLDPTMLSQALVWLWIIPQHSHQRGRNLDPERLGCAHGGKVLNEENPVAVPILPASKAACE